MKNTAYFFLLFVMIITGAQRGYAQQASVEIGGDVTTPFKFLLDDVKQFPPVTISRKDKDGKDHQYTGVRLYELLKKAGIASGKDHKGDYLLKYVVVEATDGYKVLFALTELDPDFTDRTVILANIMDGKPLPASDGPFRIVVPDEKKAARCARQVTRIRVVFAK